MLFIVLYCSLVKRKHANGLKHQMLPLMGATRPASVFCSLLPWKNAMFIHEIKAHRKHWLHVCLWAFSLKSDAGRVAPISACVFYQIDRLKSGFEAMGRTVMPGNCALMGATRLASGKWKKSKQALLNNSCTILDARRVAPISACALCSNNSPTYLFCHFTCILHSLIVMYWYSQSYAV